MSTESAPRRGLGASLGRGPTSPTGPVAPTSPGRPASPARPATAAPASVGGAIQRRLDALAEAIEVARGRLPDPLLDEVTASVARSAARLRHSDEHTVVAIAGSTGSGKSSTFNALVGQELSVAGAQRPTTAKATAVVCGADDAGELLDWLEVLPQHRHPFTDPAPGSQRTRLPDGLVLLDLPDHDSLEVAHHQEAERIVELADLLIWVVDPQKYADAAIHRRFLQPLSGHRDVTIVVLNHIDTIPADRRQALVRDLRKVLAADGIKDPRILATSAIEGTGMDELRAAVVRRVEDRRSAIQRVRADLRAAIGRLEAASGDGAVEVSDVWVGDLERRVGEAAGLPDLVARTEREARIRFSRAASWPFVHGSPASRGTAASDDASTRGRTVDLDRPAVDTAVRSLVDQACRGLAAPWADPVRRAATAQLVATDERLEAELAGVRVDGSPAPRLGLLAPARLLLVALAVAGLGLLAVSPVGGAIGLGLALLLLAVTFPVGRAVADRAARDQGAAVEDALHRVITRVVRGQVVDPMRIELARHGRFRAAIQRAAT